MVLSDKEIIALAKEGMIEPFEARQVRFVSNTYFRNSNLTQEDPLTQSPSINKETRVISYGVSSYGYDARVDRFFKVFTNVHNTLVDPKEFNDKSFFSVEGDYCIIPPNSFALARTVEYFRVPRDILVICLGKSTYARCGIIVNVTPLEPEWEGHVTLEFSNTTPLPAKIYSGEGACQFVFLKASQVCEVSYADRGGKYQGQRDITLPKL